MLRLTSSAMTQFARERLITTELILHSAAMTARFEFRVEMLIWLVNSVRCSLLPFRYLLFTAAAVGIALLALVVGIGHAGLAGVALGH